MDQSRLEINFELLNDKVQFRAVSATNPERPLQCDYLAPVGDGDGFRGLELLVMSFGNCAATGIVGILRRMQKHPVSFRAQVTGEKSEQPLALQRIAMEVQVACPELTAEEMDRALKLAEGICPVWNAIKGNVAVDVNYSLV